MRRAVADLGIRYPVAIDNDYAIWRGFANHYWPAHYFVDAAGYVNLPAAGTRPRRATGAQAEPDIARDLSGETYVG